MAGVPAALDAAREMIDATKGVAPFDVVGHGAAIGRTFVLLEALVQVCEDQEERVVELEERLGLR